MSRRKKINLVILLVMTIGAVTQVFAAPPQKETKTLPYFAGLDVLFSKRIGYYTFEHLDTRQDSAKKMLLLTGFSLGKRYYAASWLRFEAEAMFHFGSIVEDTFYVPGEFSSKYGHRNIGANLNIHFHTPSYRRILWFGILGGGINYLHVQEKTVNPQNHADVVNVAGYSGLDLKQWSPHANLGFGFDFKITKNLGISISHAFRFWQPVKYLEGRNMPLEAIEYRETFYTHMIQIKLLTGLGGE